MASLATLTDDHDLGCTPSDGDHRRIGAAAGYGQHAQGISNTQDGGARNTERGIDATAS
jgi:hypothetical protein